MSTGTTDRQLGQPGEAGINNTMELAEISGMSLVGTDRSGLVIFRGCLMSRWRGRSSSLPADEAEECCTLGRG
jgi:hypothetical protein